MPSQGPSARVAVFVDHQNLYHGLKEQFPESNGAYDFAALVREVVRGRRLVAWNHFCGTVCPNREPTKSAGQDGWHRSMRLIAAREAIPLNLHLRPLVYPPGYPRSNGRGPSEKGIDALIVQEMLVGAFDATFDVLVLLSGDRDFYCVLELMKKRFAHVAIETLYPNCRRHLREHVPHVFDTARVLDKHAYQRIRRK